MKKQQKNSKKTLKRKATRNQCPAKIKTPETVMTATPRRTHKVRTVPKITNELLYLASKTLCDPVTHNKLLRLNTQQEQYECIKHMVKEVPLKDREAYEWILFVYAGFIRKIKPPVSYRRMPITLLLRILLYVMFCNLLIYRCFRAKQTPRIPTCCPVWSAVWTVSAPRLAMRLFPF